MKYLINLEFYLRNLVERVGKERLPLVDTDHCGRLLDLEKKDLISICTDVGIFDVLLFYDDSSSGDFSGEISSYFTI